MALSQPEATLLSSSNLVVGLRLLYLEADQGYKTLGCVVFFIEKNYPLGYSLKTVYLFKVRKKWK